MSVRLRRGPAAPRMLARLVLAVLLLAAPLAWAPLAYAQPLSVLGSWSGTFTWDEEADAPQRIEIEFTAQTSGPNGTQRFSGQGVYRTDRVTRIAVTLDLDPRTRAVTMTESAPDQPDFVTDGRHVGILSEDGTRIEAVWTPKSDDGRGRLVLTRGGGK